MGQDPFPYLIFLTDTLRTVSSHYSLEAVKGTRLQIHVEAPSLEPRQLMIRHNAVIVHVTDLEDAVEGFLAQISQVLQRDLELVVPLSYYLVLIVPKRS